MNAGPDEPGRRGSLRQPPNSTQPTMTAGCQSKGKPIESGGSDLHDRVERRGVGKGPQEGIEFLVMLHGLSRGSRIEKRRAVVGQPEQQPCVSLSDGQSVLKMRRR